ncbi:hypothetical protein PVL29_013054 [Vitis rotundifolia]|uniref:Protein kinase domain-containing protein n=1 Tax=Vitis rotundifolia TaxID=103349 RepID=A0AA38ZKD0_VITRO|nr:hypothetical protein PVL29_013054 [Vitis rotundifolia]
MLKGDIQMQKSSGNYPLNFMVPSLSIFLFFLFCFESEGNRSLHSMDSNTMISLRGLMRIYWMEMVHRDLKSVDCLVDKHLTIKICDFGLSWILTTTPMRDISSAGTPEWMAQELI